MCLQSRQDPRSARVSDPAETVDRGSPHTCSDRLSSRLRRTRGRRLGRHANLDRAVHNANLEAIDLDAFVVAPGAVADAESPAVPGASYDSVLELARRQRGAHMRTEIVNGAVLTPIIEDRDHAAVDFKRHSRSLGDLVGSRNG